MRAATGVDRVNAGDEKGIAPGELVDSVVSAAIQIRGRNTVCDMLGPVCDMLGSTCLDRR